jgi:cytochrome c1
MIASLSWWMIGTFTVPNTPANLVRWLRDPQTIAPGSAMPDLGVGTQVALDMAAYLYGSIAPSAASIKAR